MKISVIMPVYLGYYEGQTKKPNEKFIRAITSFIKQSYHDCELIVISDGCKEAVKILKSKYKQSLNSGFIKLIELPRHEAFTGSVRQTGIDAAIGDVICNLDSDDEFLPNHLMNISVAFKPNDFDWAYFNAYRKLDSLNNVEELLDAQPNLDSLYTTNVVWKKGLDVTWNNCDGRQDNKSFNSQLLEKYPRKTKIFGCGYIIRNAVIK